MIKARPENIEALLKSVSEYQILAYYFGISEIPCVIPAPYRTDNKPSVSIFEGRDGSIRFKDQARGDHGRILDLLMLTWGCTSGEAFRRLGKEISSIRQSPDKKKGGHLFTRTEKPVIHHSSSDLKVKVREWRDYDYRFWEEQGVDKWLLNISNTYPISTIFFIKDGVTTKVPADKYAYAYVEFKDGEPTIKVYQPFSQYLKWVSKHDSSVWDLWDLLPESGDNLVITSSRKDAMCIWCLTDTPSTSLQGEGYVPKHHVVEDLKGRFRRVHVLFDNDFDKTINYGRSYGERIATELGLHQAEIPSMYRSKDPSDLTRTHGRLLAARVLRDIIGLPPAEESNLPF